MAWPIKINTLPTQHSNHVSSDIKHSDLPNNKENIMYQHRDWEGSLLDFPVNKVICVGSNYAKPHKRDGLGAL